MYETYFGFSSPPFLLNPDPSFYFGSKGHSSALSYLKFGLYQAEGFIVVTGDIGAGKTTLVRTLLSDIDSEKVVAAQLVSTQLEAGDLLRSAITAFGIPLKGNSKAELIATLEAYLTLLATQNKRAVLIVDEAQNLSRDAIEELRMLSNFQYGNQALLQSFLIGQPELREMLLSRSLEQLRQRVIASYHLGPMDREETRRYVEHRLTKVGWTGEHPRFDDDAFDELYQWTSGTPRRINLLCNRILLSTFLAGGDEITAAAVARIAMEIRAEIGEALPSRVTAPASDAPPSSTSAPSDVDPHAPRPLVIPTLTHSVEPGDWASSGPAAFEPSYSVNDQGDTNGSAGLYFLLIAGSMAGALRAAALQQAFATRAGVPSLKVLQIDCPGHFELSAELMEHTGLKEPHFRLRLPAGTPVNLLADGMRQLDHLLSEYRPFAVIVQAGDDVGLAASLVAQRLGIRIVHLEAGLRSFDRSRPQEINAMMCDHMADMLLTSEWVAHDNLAREGIPADRIQFVGNVLMDTIRSMLPQASPPKYTLRQFNHNTDFLKNKQGYGLVYLEGRGVAKDPDRLHELAHVFHTISRDMPLIWAGSDRIRPLLNHPDLIKAQAEGHIILLPTIPYFKMIGLIGTAACVLTDSCTLQEEATILGVPCLTLHNFTERRITVEQGSNIAVGRNTSLISRAVAEILRGGGKKGRLPKFWDGHSANRVAEHLISWAKAQMGPARISPGKTHF
ncbi:MAG TPA: XrtA/PEP-CTERM system-associated ATPase [Aquabacterium sp.]|nr:XrtA/PEP-CTERM system-associated ATPase [Aquabacterium sp.]